MKTVPNGDGFLFAASGAILTFLLPSHTEGWCFPPSEGERKPKDGEPMVFLSIAKRYATGISFTVRSKIAYRRSPRVRTPAAYFKAHSRPFGNPSSFLIRVTVCRRQGGKVRAPHGGCAGRNQKTSRWDVFPYGCDRLVRSSHKRRTEVWALSAAVRPAFAVLIYAPEPSGKGIAILHENA